MCEKVTRQRQSNTHHSKVVQPATKRHTKVAQPATERHSKVARPATERHSKVAQPALESSLPYGGWIPEVVLRRILE
jgi:hypothetical protein